MLRVALTGGIASGKTMVSNAFSALGVPIVDADIAARAVVAPQTEGLQQLVNLFGSSILLENGELNRRALRERIFTDEQARLNVNAILHPLIRQHMKNTAKQYASPYVLFVIPLLLESDQVDEYDHVVVVVADRNKRIQRLCQRDKISADDAEKILAAQSNDAERQKIADHIIDNNGDAEHLQQQVEQLHQHFLQLATTG